MQIQNKCEFCFNGTDTLNLATMLITKAFESSNVNKGQCGFSDSQIHIQPVNLMILDMQMPGFTGLEVISRVKQLILELNNSDKYLLIEEPVFVIVTAFVNPQLSNHLKKYKITKVFEKPISQAQLQEILVFSGRKLCCNFTHNQ